MTKIKQVSVPYMVMGVLFCVCLILANVLATKQLGFSDVECLGLTIPFSWLQLTGGVIVFPLSYIINDCIAEVWGYRRARLIIWLAFATNALFVLFGALADALPGAVYWDNDAGFHQIFGLAPRIALASFLSFLVGSFLNAYVMSKMKLAHGGKRFAWRAVASTIVGETADSLIFFPLALGGIVPWVVMPAMIVSQLLFKVIYEILVLPLTARIVAYIKRIDNTDVYDTDVSYSVFRVTDV